MPYGRQYRQITTASPTPMSHWKERDPVHDTHHPPDPASLPFPPFPPALDFDADDFIAPYHHSIDLEKAIIHPLSSLDTLLSDTPTPISTASFPGLPKPHLQQWHMPLPPKRYLRFVRHLRYTLLTVYRRLFTLAFLANLISLILLLHNGSVQTIDLNTLATAASANFLAAILIRQDFVVNGIFRTAWMVPWSVPLRVRRWVARCYCYGGIHSGAAVAGTGWWIVFSILLSLRFAQEGMYTLPILITTYFILSLLIVILVLAFPTLRSRYHNTFELTHRFLGWSSIVLFWTQFLLLIQYAHGASRSFHSLLLHHPTFWTLTLTTALLIHPWLRLRTWTFTPELLSPHAVRLHFNEPVHKFSCLLISSSPWREWHPFATFPSPDPERPGNSMIISDAGDWTRSLIRRAQAQAQRLHQHNALLSTVTTCQQPDAQMQMRFWVKSSPKAGVLSLSAIFPRVILLTTGSGIGPCLSSLLDRPATQFARLIWSTRSPIETYGEALYETVLHTDPDALVIDTTSMERPDLVSVAWRMYQEVDAEAVFVLSNAAVTRKVVYGLESRGVPAFGPIWDS